MDTTKIQEEITKTLTKEYIVIAGFEVKIVKNPHDETNNVEITILGNEHQG